MSILTYPLGFIGGGKEFYNNVMENGLLSDGTSYLSRTPQTAGNRKTLTISTWIKPDRVPSGTEYHTLLSVHDGTHRTNLYILPSDGKIYFEWYNGSSYPIDLAPSVVLRDVSSWYHFVLSMDTTDGTSTDRVKMYLNGERLTSFSPATYPSQNDEPLFNSTNEHRVGGHSTVTARNFTGCMTDYYFIDGFALGPENFGEYKEGIWIPKAYAGPPPIVSDSSSQNNDIVFNGVGVGHLNYDEYYIGESSIEFGNSNAYSATIGSAGGIESGGPFDFTTEEWTIDFWIKTGPSVSGSHMTILHAEGDANAAPSSADFYNFVWINFDASGAPTIYIYLAPNSGGDAFYGSASASGISGVDQWMHFSVIRDNSQSLGQNSATTIAVFGNGVQYTLTINSGGVAPTDNLDTATVMNGKGMTLFGNNVYGYTSQVMDRKLDEFRIVKGDARPPRFYFGTQYGDASGGVLPQRATSTHRFTDDERTVLLVSGQSVNTHARATSLVDESGVHLDNVHDAASNVLDYPTQDGVGKQFTMDGPQHTTRDSFVGNTSSIVFDGSDDYIEIDATSFRPGADDFTVDFWYKTAPEMEEDRDRIFRSHTGLIIQTYRDGTSNTPDRLYVNAPMSGTNELTLNMTAIEDHLHNNAWHHISVVKAANTECFAFIDGKMMLSTTTNVASTMDDNTKVTIGGDGTYHAGGYLDEIRTMTGSADKPQIKFTHTQTAGAGNKDAYDVHGWRVHGHEFTDDNATSLLIHADSQRDDVADAWYNFDGTNDSIEIPQTWGGTAQEAFTVAAWVKVDSYTNNADGIYNGNVGSPADYNFYLGLGTSGGNSWDFRIIDGGAGVAAFTDDTNWHLLVGTWSMTSARARLYFDGVLAQEGPYEAAINFTDHQTVYLGRGISSEYFDGGFAQFGLWDVELDAAAVQALYDKGINGSWNTTSPNYTNNTSSDLMNYYVFGSTFTGVDGTQIDSGTALYDRSGNNRDASAVTGVTLISGGDSASIFKDSSSTNSIEHALISGGGVAHTKAVTLNSDGTNGTSTTDHAGNTIYFGGSNSTLEFANSSSFDYGNTSIFFTANNTVYTPASSDFVIGTKQFGVSMWVYVSSENNNQENGLFSTRADAREGIILNVNGGTDANSDRLDALAPNADGTGWEQNLLGPVGSFVYDAWNHVEFGRGPNNLYTLKQNGIVVSSNTSSTSVNGDGTVAPRIGRAAVTDSNNLAMTGYLDEVMFTVGEYVQSRFYLGNQAPKSDATFSEFKYGNFSGDFNSSTNGPHYRKDSGVDDYRASDTQGTILAWVYKNGSGTHENVFSSCYAGSPNDFEEFTINSDGRLQYSKENGTVGNRSTRSHGLTCPIGQWALVGWQSTGTTNNFFVNDRISDVTTSGTVVGYGDGMWFGNQGVNGTGALGTTRNNISLGAMKRSNHDYEWTGKISQLGVWGGTSGTTGVLTHAQVKSIFEAGPGGDWNVAAYNTGLVNYWNFGIAAGTDTPSITTLYDIVGSLDLTQSGLDPISITTAYTPSNSSKRLTYGPIEYSSNVQANTAVVGNTHYGNTVPNSVSGSNFKGFVDDEYTVLLMRGGHADGNTVFYDGNTAAGETITFPPHSYSYGKTRIAETIAAETNSTHEVTNELGLHGSSIKTTGSDSGFLIGEDNFPGSNFDFSGDVSWCMEFWIYPNAMTGAAFMGNMTPSSGPGHAGIAVYEYNGSSSRYTGILWASTNGSTYYWTTEYAAISTGSWQHVILQHDAFNQTYATPDHTPPQGNQNITMFINGVNIGFSDARSSDARYDNREVESKKLEGHTSHGKRFHIGYDMDNGRWNALWDEIRITKGIPRYTPDGRMVQGIVPNKATGAGTLGTLIPTIPYLRPTPFVASDSSRGYFDSGNIKVLLKSDTVPGDTVMVDSSTSFTGDLVLGQGPEGVAGFTSLENLTAVNANVAIETDKGRNGSGTNAIKITRTADSYQYFHFNMPLGTGTYTVSYFATYGGGTTGLTASPQADPLRVYVGGTAGTDGISSGRTDTLTTGWVKYEFEFSGTNDSSTFFNVVRNNTSNAGHVYVSDFEVTTSNVIRQIKNADHTAVDKPLIKTANSATDYALSGGADGIYLDGSSYNLHIPAHEDFNMGVGDFTIEGWFNFHTIADNRGIFSLGGPVSINSTGHTPTWHNAAGTFGIRWSGTGLQVKANGSTVASPLDAVASGTHGITTDSWHHIATQRLDGQLSLIIDGVSMGRVDDTSNLTRQPFYLGYYSESPYYGNFTADEIRISKMARYTGQGLIDSDYPNPSTEFGIQTEGTTYGRFDTQVTANTTYKRYNYEHTHWKSYVFDGTSSKVDWGDQVDFTIGDASTDGDFSIATWVNFTTDPADYEPFLGKWDNTQASTKEWLFRPSTSNKWEFRLVDASTGYTRGIATTYETITVGEWTLVVGTLDSSGTTYVNKMDIYLNGIVTSKTDLTDGSFTATENTTATLELGYLTGTSGGYGGPFRISNLAIWKGRTLTASEVKEIYFLGPGANWKTTYGTSMVLYNTFGNHDTLTVATADTATALYDRSGSPSIYNASTVSNIALNSDTKLLIHSNTDIDGDTSIIDSSSSEYMINRVVGDPTYANTGGTRTGMGDQGYMGIDFNKGESATSGSSRQNKLIIPTAPALKYYEDWSVVMWYKWLSTGSATTSVDKYFWSYGAGYGQDGGAAIRQDGSSTLETHVDYGTDVESNGPSGPSINDTNWHQIGCTVADAGQSGAIKFIYDGTRVDGMDTNGTTPLSGGMAIGAAKPTEDISTAIQNAYIDQVIFLQGHALTDTEVSNLYNSRNGNTAIGNLGGLIVHEEFANNTVTQNVHTTVIVHSNNATHHTQGSRKFYNDTESCRFTGATGHAHAGKFDISAGPGVFKFVGNTASRNIGGTAVAAMDNPQLRLKRGYSYVFDFGSSTGDGTHPFYFANSTANNTGYAYGSSGTRANEYITGLYGSQTAPTYANKDTLTWTPFTSGDYGNYGDGTGTTKWRYVKFEVPEDAPKNLYYRCSSHSTMGNAVFIMEKTEPPPVKVANLPALMTSGFNDRDWGGIGNSVIHFSGPAAGTLQNGIFVDGDGTDLYWPSGTAFAFECWFNSPNIESTLAQNWFSTENFYPAGTTCLQIRNTADGIQVQQTTGSSQIFETFFKSSEATANDHINQIFTNNKWHHLVVQRDGTNTWTAFADNKQLTAHSDDGRSPAQNINVDGQGIYIGGHSGTSDNKMFEGFMQDVMLYKGVSLDANTITQNYMTGRAGSFRTANSAVVVHIKSDAPYGSRTFTDASKNALTTSVKIANPSYDIYHHIQDNRTANTALYFDSYSKILPAYSDNLDWGYGDYTIEFWATIDDISSGRYIYTRGRGSGNQDESFYYDHSNTRYQYSTYNGSSNGVVIVGDAKPFVWNHVAVVYDSTANLTKMFINGVCTEVETPSIKFGALGLDSNDAHRIGVSETGAASNSWKGFLDGFRMTKGMPRYTSGIPTDGQSPAKDYDDGRSSNVSSNTWATSSTRRYYGINTHTYLQTTQYSTDANTVFLMRGDDAQTANDGVNMYNNNGFHLEFKEVGAGDERDYNNFNTGASGLGSDTSATQEFADDATLLLARSRPNQANGSVQFINEVDQSRGNVLGTSYHDEAQNIFSVDANTANVSVSSGGSGTY